MCTVNALLDGMQVLIATWKGAMLHGIPGDCTRLNLWVAYCILLRVCSFASHHPNGTVGIRHAAKISIKMNDHRIHKSKVATLVQVTVLVTGIFIQLSSCSDSLRCHEAQTVLQSKLRKLSRPQQLHHRFVPFVDRIPQRRPTAIIRQVGIDVVPLDQQLHHRFMPSLCRPQQRRPTVIVL